jgi:hypothetical protein
MSVRWVYFPYFPLAIRAALTATIAGARTLITKGCFFKSCFRKHPNLLSIPLIRASLSMAQFEFQPLALGCSLASYITIDFSNTCRPLFPSVQPRMRPEIRPAIEI